MSDAFAVISWFVTGTFIGGVALVLGHDITTAGVVQIWFLLMFLLAGEFFTTDQ